jgi:transcriptional regulator with XRE-family HTH domain
MDLFKEQKKIGEHLTKYIRLNGYSKSSFSNLTGISRPTLNLILSGDVTSPTTFENHMEKITKSLELPKDYFLNLPQFLLESWQLPSVQYSDRAERGERQKDVQVILDDLDDLLDIASLYF